jgi:hypothetical protein
MAKSVIRFRKRNLCGKRMARLDWHIKESLFKKNLG